MRLLKARIGLAILLAVVLVAGIAVVVLHSVTAMGRTHMVAYFDNSNGLFKGDEVRILGVPAGAIDRIEPQTERVKISFWVNDKYKIPADVKAAILSPQLITSRAIQLTPPYTAGPVLTDGAVIPQNRTAVPMEWDDLRAQLEKLTEALQPTQEGGVSTLGAFVNTAADNLRGQGATIRDALIKLSQAFSILGDHSPDIFSTIKHLSVLVSALQGSTTALRQLNRNLAAVTALVAEDPNAVGAAVKDIDTAAADVQGFIAENRDALGTATDKLSSISQAVVDSLDDIKQTLHVAPNAFQNFLNIFQPSQLAFTGELSINNFANPIQFLCAAVEAAARLGNEQSAKLCMQYLAPILKNRQYNFPPIGEDLFVGEAARPNELTYSEDWLRPDNVPPPPAPAPNAPPPADAPPPPEHNDVSAAQPKLATDPGAGLPGLMVPPSRGGS